MAKHGKTMFAATDSGSAPHKELLGTAQKVKAPKKPTRQKTKTLRR